MMWKPSTAEGYRKKLNNYIFPAFGNKPLGNINAGMLQEYFYNLYLNTAFAVSSIDNIRALLSQIFKYAVNNNHLMINPLFKTVKIEITQNSHSRATCKNKLRATTSCTSNQRLLYIKFIIKNRRK